VVKLLINFVSQIVFCYRFFQLINLINVYAMFYLSKKGVAHPLKLWIQDAIHILFPNVCACCGTSLYAHEPVVCQMCLTELPQTFYHLEPGNPVEKVFWGRVPMRTATSIFHFNKGNRVQTLIHGLKYKNRPDIGQELGRVFGPGLMMNPSLATAYAFIPVPLHTSKIKKRGYNQSEEIAKGFSSSMNIPLLIDVLQRATATDTQTKKSRTDRWENVKEVFCVQNPEFIQGKDLILVDDVVTTGATIEACAHVLLDAGCRSVSLVALAYTD
jgi:ComF family protein